MIMTVCRRTRASRQIFSRPLHSLGVAAEVTEAPTGWQEEAVLFSVPPEGLSILESHRTSQHSASLSDGWSPKRPEKKKTLDEKAEVPLLCTCIYNRGSLVVWCSHSRYYRYTNCVLYSTVLLHNQLFTRSYGRPEGTKPKIRNGS